MRGEQIKREVVTEVICLKFSFTFAKSTIITVSKETER